MKRKIITKHRCTGKCCEAFCVHGYTPEKLLELRNEAEQRLNETKKLVDDCGELIPEELRKELISRQYNFQQLNKIQSMVVPIGILTRNPNLPDNGEHEPTQYYTCKHFDLVSRNCLDYHNRPDMCRMYPDYGHGGKCPYKDCEFEYEIIDPLMPGSKEIEAATTRLVESQEVKDDQR